MSDRSLRFGIREPVGRTYGYGGGKKVGAAVATSAYTVNSAAIDVAEKVFRDRSIKTFTEHPGPGGFTLCEGEVAFVLRGSSTMVLTALNGLDHKLAGIFPNDEELVRQLLYEMVQPVGFVQQQPTTAKCAKVTLRVSGTHWHGAPHVYNFGTYGSIVNAKQYGGFATDPHITPGCAIVMDIPNLKNPIQFGNATTGAGPKKIRLVPRALDKRKAATRIALITGVLNRDPEKFKLAMAEFEGVKHSWIGVAKAVQESYLTAFLMGLDVFLKRDILKLGDGAPELARAGAASEDIVARIAEYLGMIRNSTTATAALGDDARQRWAETRFELINRQLPTPSATSNKTNAAYQFGFSVNPATGVFSSKALVGGKGSRVKDDAIGKLFTLSLNHWDAALQAIAGAVYSESKNIIGYALTEPSVQETSQYQMFIAPHGGMTTRSN